MGLRESQELACDFLYEHDRAMILAPVGAGKTAIVLTTMADMLRTGVATRFLVVAPKRVCDEVWERERAIWAPSLTMSIATGTPKERLAAVLADTRVVVINYDNLIWLAEQKFAFDAIVFDELTRLKDPKGKRFKALETILDTVRYRWGLTGSFTSNGLEDVFGQCKMIDRGLLGRSKGAFLQKYFLLVNPDYGQWEPRRGALEQVMKEIRPAVFQMDAKEYYDALPPLRIVPILCGKDDAVYRSMKNDLKVQFPSAKAVAANGGVVTGKLKQIASGFVYDTKRWPNPDKPGKWLTSSTPITVGAHKYERLDALLESNQRANTIVFYWYKEELAELKKRYPHGESEVDVERWNAGEIELLFAHPKSMGHGLNLQFGGCHCVFLTLPFYSRELFEQAIGRLHRSGQKHAVWVYLLLAKGSVDEYEWEVIQGKADVSNAAQAALEN